MHVAVWHRNHIAVMSNFPITYSNGVYNYNFSLDSTQVYGGLAGHKEIVPGIYGMAAGDANGDGFINATDKLIWNTEAGHRGYLMTDFNLNGQVNHNDANECWLINTAISNQIPD